MVKIDKLPFTFVISGSIKIAGKTTLPFLLHSPSHYPLTDDISPLSGHRLACWLLSSHIRALNCLLFLVLYQSLSFAVVISS